MLIISHRGNIDGVNKFFENNPVHIFNLLKNNIQVEIDVWFKDGNILLGHDEPQHIIDYEFLKQDGLWCHAKNLNALYYMIQNNIKNYFWHQEDYFTLTSSKYIWTYPTNLVTDKSIIVDLSKNWKNKNYDCFGVCVDFLN
jgi:hypothetical protein